MAYDEATAQAIAERIATGEPMAKICRDQGMPHVATVWRWTEDNPDFAQSIARARALGHDAIAASLREVARGDTSAGSTGDVARDKLIVETDLKLLAKWDKRYGDRSELALTGANGSDLFAGLGKAELLAELARRMSTPEIARALSGVLPSLPKPEPKG